MWVRKGFSFIFGFRLFLFLVPRTLIIHLSFNVLRTMEDMSSVWGGDLIVSTAFLGSKFWKEGLEERLKSKQIYKMETRRFTQRFQLMDLLEFFYAFEKYTKSRNKEMRGFHPNSAVFIIISIIITILIIIIIFWYHKHGSISVICILQLWRSGWYGL